MTVALILVAFVLGLVLGWWYARRSSPATVVTLPPDDSTQLYLCKKGQIEHEIAWHGPHVPGHYSYAGKRYVRYGRRDDGWEFRR